MKLHCHRIEELEGLKEISDKVIAHLNDEVVKLRSERDALVAGKEGYESHIRQLVALLAQERRRSGAFLEVQPDCLN